MNCINTKSKEFQKLLEASKLPSFLLEMRIAKWQEQNGLDNFPKVEDIIQSNEVNTTLKAVDILQSDKAKQVFEKGKKVGWDLNKILTELQIPKDQKQLLLDLDITDREQLALELTSNYSYTVEINTTKTKEVNLNPVDDDTRYYEKNGKYYKSSPYENEAQPLEISKEQYESYTTLDKPTQHYSNLTVPGGTNYTEQEISTPLITPSIKGHAQFATDNGIGWFRSDDKAIGTVEEDYEDDSMAFMELDENFNPIPNTTQGNVNRTKSIGGTATKTRRILEVQSDLFQKGRDKEWLSREMDSLTPEEVNNEPEWLRPIGTIVKSDSKKNAFLNLLIKDNNWVTFFVKSIIQDSAKKGYEKVLFPSGNTASKVEGHTTLEEFKKQKEDRLKGLQSAKIIEKEYESYNENTGETEILPFRVEYEENNKRYSLPYKNKEDAQKVIDSYSVEINQLKQELEQVEGPGGFGALKPIYNFYENTVTNILNKTYGKNNVKVITDEYGNTWNELTLDNNRDTSTILFNKVSSLLDPKITKEIFSITDNQFEKSVKNVDNSQANKQLLFNANNQNSLLTSEVLTNILEQIPENLTDEFKVLLDKASKILNNTKAKVEVSTLAEMSKKYDKVDSTVAMLYDANTNKIVISEEALTKLNSQEIVQSFIHEVVHAIVVKAIKNPQTFEEKQLRDLLVKAYNQYKDLAETNSNGDKSYGFESIDEFVAEIYSNPEFQNELKTIEKSFWSKFVDELRRLINLINTSKNRELVDAVLLINRVTNLVEQTNNSDFTGFAAESGIKFDAMFKKFDNFAEENKIKPEIQKIINDIIDNDNFIKLSEDQKNYVNLNNGILYERVTSYIQDKEIIENDLLKTASALGNKVDEFVRDYFDDNLQSFESYNLSSKKELFQFKTQLDKLQKIIQANGEHVIAKNIVLYNDDLKLAGTIDLMTVSKTGEIKIYDVKSMRGNQFETSYYNDENSKYDTKRYGSSKREMHQKQLSLYRILLNNTHGLNVVDLNVIPVELEYNENDINSNVVNLLEIVNVKALNKVKDAEFISKNTKQKGSKVRVTVLSESEGYNLDTIEKQIQNVLNKAKDVLNQNIAHYKAVTKSIKDPLKKQQWTKFVDNFDDTLNSLETLAEGDELTGILNYVNSLQKGVASLKSSFDRKEFTEEETIQVVHNYTKYLDSFTIHKDIQKLLSDIKVNNKFDSDTIDISEIENALDSVVSDYTKLKSEYSAFLKNAIKLKLSTLKYLPELETMWINKLKTEYKSSPKSISQTEWIANAMNTTYKEDIDADIEDYLNKLINNPSFDISIGTHFLSSAINTNSHLIQIFNQILNEVKEEINQTMRTKEFELKGLFDKLVKEKGSSSVSVLYKNLISKNPNGNYSLVNDIKNLSKIEKEVLMSLKDIQDFVDYSTYGKQSKKVKINGQVYYELPSITKSDLERVLEGDIKGTIKDKWTDLTTIKADDVEFRYKTDNEHNLLYNVPVRYRAKIEAKDQSLDVLTVYRLEYLNGVNFKVKTKAEKDLTTIIDIAKSKEYYREEGGIKNYVKSTFTKNNEIELTPGEKSNTLKMLNSLLETNIYDIGHRYAGKTGKVDNNKLLSFFNGATASIGLSLNRFGATANVINAKAQVFLEGISKGVINNNNIKKAELLYSKEIFNGNLFNDLGQPVEKSFINQMNRMFDTFGFNQNAMNDFVKQGILKSYSNLGTLQFMHKTGEHWVQSVLTAAVLDSVKVMNSDNRFIDKKGNEVSEDKAASLLDMLYIDSKDGILKISDKVVYTTKSLTSKINEGGKEKINLLIERKIKDCFGNYNPTTQPEASRHIWGKLTLPFRRFYVEMATKRFKAFGSSSKTKDEMEANPRYKHYNYALQSYDEGTYTSLVRFLRHGVIPMLKQMKFHILSQEWEKLSDLERANIKHSVSEITATLVILPLIGMLLGNMLGGNDDDDEMIYFWMYQTRRLTTELAQFRNPSENIKMTRSPIPSMRLIENGIDVIGKTLNFWSWDEEMKSGPNKGDLKIGRAWSKMIPVLNQIDKNSKDLYKYQTAMFGSY